MPENTIEQEATALLSALKANAKRKRQQEVSQKLIEQFNFKTIPGKKTDTILYYKDGYYRAGGEVIIKTECEQQLGKAADNHSVNEIIGRIKRLTYTEESFFTPNINLINLKNGILNLQTRQLEAHSPDIGFRHQLPLIFDINAKCPAIEVFLSDRLFPKDIPVIYEFLGHCLLRRYHIKKAVIFLGDQDTGKTTTLGIIVSFLGEQNISGESLQRITTDKFSAINLYGRLANIYDDLRYSDINDTGSFKAATGGGYITGEEKFGDRKPFVSYAKLAFAGNQMPRIKDSSDITFFGRWRVLRFPYQIEQKNPLIIEQLSRPEEMSGLLNMALDGLDRLIKNGDFSNQPSAEETKSVMLQDAEPLMAFVVDCLENVEGAAIPKDLMHELYSKYAELNARPIFTKTKLTQRLPVFLPGLTTGQRENSGGRRVECYVNVALNENLKENTHFQGFFKKHEEQFPKITTYNIKKSSETPAISEEVVL